MEGCRSACRGRLSTETNRRNRQPGRSSDFRALERATKLARTYSPRLLDRPSVNDVLRLSFPVTAAGPFRNFTGFPILPAATSSRTPSAISIDNTARRCGQALFLRFVARQNRRHQPHSGDMGVAGEYPRIRSSHSRSAAIPPNHLFSFFPCHCALMERGETVTTGLSPCENASGIFTRRSAAPGGHAPRIIDPYRLLRWRGGSARDLDSWSPSSCAALCRQTW